MEVVILDLRKAPQRTNDPRYQEVDPQIARGERDSILVSASITPNWVILVDILDSEGYFHHIVNQTRSVAKIEQKGGHLLNDEQFFVAEISDFIFVVFAGIISYFYEDEEDCCGKDIVDD